VPAPAQRDHGPPGQIKFISHRILDNEFAADAKRAIIVAYDVHLITHWYALSPFDYCREGRFLKMLFIDLPESAPLAKRLS